MRFTPLLLVLLLALAVALPVAAQDADTDADTILDLYDSCPAQAGLPENSGCPQGVTPDFDADGISDFEDLCFNTPGTPDLLGCTIETLPDQDADTVADPLDACYDQPGLPANSGCPEGVVADLDADTVPDAQDACPREYGEGANGCPPDLDADTIPDFADACPDAAGTTENYGCPAGTSAPDADGDTVPDLFDQCPAAAGMTDLGGCPDTDGDTQPDQYDLCPNEAGTLELAGCPYNETFALPAALAPITPANAAQLAPVAQVVVGAQSFDLAGSTMAILGYDRLYTYPLTAGAANTPTVTVPLDTAVSPVTLGADAQQIVTIEFPPEYTGPATATIRSAQLAPLATVAPAALSADAPGVSVGRVAASPNPALPLVAVVEDIGMGFGSGAAARLTLRSLVDGAIVREIALPDTAANVVWSPDAARLAYDTVVGEAMQAVVIDTATGSQLAAFTTSDLIYFDGTPMAFTPDGTRLAVGTPDGAFTLYDIASAAPVWTVQPFDQAQSETVSSVAVSPVGGVIAVAGGVPFSGGLTGSEIYPIVLVDAASGAEVGRINSDYAQIYEMEFSADGTLLYTLGAVRVVGYGVAA